MTGHRFAFPLEKVLRLRRELEEAKARALAEARADETGFQEARQALVQQRDVGRARLAAVHQQGGAVGHIQNLEYVLERVADQIRDADEACRRAEETVTSSLEDFRAAFVDRKSLDQLRTRRKAEWHAHSTRNEQKAMDEVATTRHVRGSGASTAQER